MMESWPSQLISVVSIEPSRAQSWKGGQSVCEINPPDQDYAWRAARPWSSVRLYVSLLVMLVNSEYSELTILVLMARDDSTFKENPAGISSMLFYHASIIIHGMFSIERFVLFATSVHVNTRVRYISHQSP